MKMYLYLLGKPEIEKHSGTKMILAENQEEANLKAFDYHVKTGIRITPLYEVKGKVSSNSIPLMEALMNKLAEKDVQRFTKELNNEKLVKNL